MMTRWITAILLLASGGLFGQELPCDHPDRTPLEISIPNVFTPNDDGVNDLFRGEYNILAFDQISLHVYNRAGQLMFFADRPNQGWDGRTPVGAKCPTGTYFYVLDYRTPCETDRRSGVFELIR